MGNQRLDVPIRSVDAEVVIELIAPYLPGVVKVIPGAISVHLTDVLADLLVRKMLGALAALQAAPDTAFHVRVYKDAIGRVIPQDEVRAAAHDDAVRLLRQAAQDVALGLIHRLEDLRVVVGGEVDGMVHGDGIEPMGPSLHHLPDIVLRKAGVLRDLLDDLPVVVLAAQRLGKPPAKLPAAAAEFPAHSYDTIHRMTSPMVVSFRCRSSLSSMMSDTTSAMVSVIGVAHSTRSAPKANFMKNRSRISKLPL